MTQKVFTDDDGGYHSENRLFTLQHVLETTRTRLSLIRDLGIKFLVIFGINRGGTTALQLLATQLAGVRCSEFQPFKDILRNGADRATSLAYSEGELQFGDVMVIKETLGPLQEAECTLDPVHFLIEAGIPPADIAAIFVLRDPCKTYYSWTKFIEVKLGSFCLSQRSVITAFQAHQEQLGACIPLCYEMLEQEAMLREVFRRTGIGNGLQLDFDPDLLQRKVRWNEADPERGEEERYYWEHVVVPMINKGGFRYNGCHYPAPPPNVLQHLEREALPQYQEWRRLCDSYFS